MTRVVEIHNCGECPHLDARWTDPSWKGGNRMAKYPWSDEPTPLCAKMDEVKTISEPHVHAAELLLKARDLERRLRHALKLVGKLRADSECGDFDEDDLEQRLARIEETLTP